MNTFSFLPMPPISGPAPLLIAERERDKLRAIRERALASPVDVSDIRERLKTTWGQRQHKRRLHSQTMSLPVGYQVTYSLEVGHPGGAARHMSLSSRPGRLPTREALEMVADELGFDLPLTPETAMFWLEDLKDRDGKAVNVVQLVRARHGGQA